MAECKLGGVRVDATARRRCNKESEMANMGTCGATYHLSRRVDAGPIGLVHDMNIVLDTQ